MAKAGSLVFSGSPPAALQERRIRAGVRGLRQFFETNFKGVLKLFNVGSSRRITLALSAIIPPLSSRILRQSSSELSFSCILRSRAYVVTLL